MRREKTIIRKAIELHMAAHEARTCPFLLFFRRLRIKHYREALEWALNNPNVEDLL